MLHPVTERRRSLGCFGQGQMHSRRFRTGAERSRMRRGVTGKHRALDASPGENTSRACFFRCCCLRDTSFYLSCSNGKNGERQGYTSISIYVRKGSQRWSAFRFLLHDFQPCRLPQQQWNAASRKLLNPMRIASRHVTNDHFTMKTCAPVATVPYISMKGENLGAGPREGLRPRQADARLGSRGNGHGPRGFHRPCRRQPADSRQNAHSGDRSALLLSP